jgi:hypothetical protein
MHLLHHNLDAGNISVIVDMEDITLDVVICEMLNHGIQVGDYIMDLESHESQKKLNLRMQLKKSKNKYSERKVIRK